MSDDRKFFFVHVMKTAGTTFWFQARRTFKVDELYPTGKQGDDLMVARTSLECLRTLPPERKDRVRLFSGHFPAMAVDVLGLDVVTMTILREPVARTISMLRHVLRGYPDHGSLEAVYENPVIYETLVHNHQAKLFALTVEDQPADYLHIIDVTPARLDDAKERLHGFDSFGLTEAYDEYITDVSRQFGWEFGDIPNQQVGGKPYDMSESFRNRIADDNAADIEFYEYARGLYRARRKAA